LIAALWPRRIAKGLLLRLFCHHADCAKIEMSNIEVIICLLLLFMAVPDLCHKLGRPALVKALARPPTDEKEKEDDVDLEAPHSVA